MIGNKHGMDVKIIRHNTLDYNILVECRVVIISRMYIGPRLHLLGIVASEGTLKPLHVLKQGDVVLSWGMRCSSRELSIATSIPALLLLERRDLKLLITRHSCNRFASLL